MVKNKLRGRSQRYKFRRVGFINNKIYPEGGGNESHIMSITISLNQLEIHQSWCWEIEGELSDF